MPWASNHYIASIERARYHQWCDGLIAQEARLAARERARIGHERVNQPWSKFRHDPRCAPGVLVWFDADEEPTLIGEINASGGGCGCCEDGDYCDECRRGSCSGAGRWVREIVDARPVLARATLGHDPFAEVALAPANDLCGGCGSDRTGGRCSAGCGWGLALLPDPTPVERGLLDVASVLGVDAGLAGWLERTASAAKALRPSAEVARGLRALSAALTALQVEHPNVLAACAWIAVARVMAERADATIPLIAPERPWVPYAGEVFEGRVRRAGILGERWYRMEWRGWYDDYEGGQRASVRPIDPGPLLGDTIEEMRPCRPAT